MLVTSLMSKNQSMYEILLQRQPWLSGLDFYIAKALLVLRAYGQMMQIVAKCYLHEVAGKCKVALFKSDLPIFLKSIAQVVCILYIPFCLVTR